MKTELSCMPCFVRQALEAVTQATQDHMQREKLLRIILHELADADWEGSPPVMAQRMQRVIRRETGCEDPYRQVKAKMNRAALEALPLLRDEIKVRPDSREAIVRAAIGGNLLDAGSKTQIAAEELNDHLRTLWVQPFRGNVEALFASVEQARRILYLADNAGEIVLDRLLVEALPPEKTTVVVRGSPVINDATREDAEVAGITSLVPVMDNGSDAPGTVLAECSAGFRQAWEEADLIIAKGQGNYETLSEAPKHIFFLFVVKCPMISEKAGSPVGTLVIHESKSL